MPTAKGQAPTRATPAPIPPDVAADLLPALTPAARMRLVDALADLALAHLGALNTGPDPEE